MTSLRVDPGSPTPPFEQLREQIRTQVASRHLRPGDRLPTVRALADELGIAPNTVARAYRELEADGLLEGRGRSGTFIADDGAGRAAKAAARAYADAVTALGLGPAAALDLARRALGT